MNSRHATVDSVNVQAFRLPILHNYNQIMNGEERNLVKSTSLENNSEPSLASATLKIEGAMQHLLPGIALGKTVDRMGIGWGSFGGLAPVQAKVELFPFLIDSLP